MKTLLAIVLLCLPAVAAPPASAQSITEDRKIIASDEQPNDAFGSSVAISGATAIIGAPRDTSVATGRGAAYLLDISTGQELFKIEASDGSTADRFGGSVAISGTTAVIGTRASSSTSTQTAYVFDTTTGQELFKLTASDAALGDRFGHSVAISGITAVIGAYLDDDGGTSSGSAYVFDTVTGQELFKLTASDDDAFDNFGRSVAVSGTTAIIGAAGDAEGGEASGAAYLFDTTTGQQLFKLTATDAEPFDQFGVCVAISGTTAVVGANFKYVAGGFAGAAYVFDTTTGQQLFKLTASDTADGDRFGESVAVSGNVAVVGAYGDDDGGASSGSAYFFDITTGQQLYKLTASDAAFDDRFGQSVAISGTNAIVGAPLEDDEVTMNDLFADRGSVYLFDRSTDFVQQPQGVVSDAGVTVWFEILLEDSSGASYRWRRDGIDLTENSNIRGVYAPRLGVSAELTEVGYYDCVVVNQFGTSISDQAILAVRPDPDECEGDIADDFGTPGGDGMVSFGDFLRLLSLIGPCP